MYVLLHVRMAERERVCEYYSWETSCIRNIGLFAIPCVAFPSLLKTVTFSGFIKVQPVRPKIVVMSKDKISNFLIFVVP
jgi:hypothetical protein